MTTKETTKETKLNASLKKFVNLESNTQLVNIFKAVIVDFPASSKIAKELKDYIHLKRLQRLEAFSKNVADDLEHLGESINKEIITTVEFVSIFEQCFRGASKNHQKEKLAAYRAIVINSAQTNSLSIDEKEYFINIVNTLTALHLKILQFIAKPEAYLAENDIPVSTIRGGYSIFFPVALPGVDLEVIKLAFDDLYKKGFINTDKSIFNTMTYGQGIELLENRMSKLGDKFIDFCSLDS